jgi:hypothetical protein
LAAIPGGHDDRHDRGQNGRTSALRLHPAPVLASFRIEPPAGRLSFDVDAYLEPSLKKGCYTRDQLDLSGEVLEIGGHELDTCAIGASPTTPTAAPTAATAARARRRRGRDWHIAKIDLIANGIAVSQVQHSIGVGLTAG